MSNRLMVIARLLPDGKSFTVHGRDAWALLQLVAAGPNGCTPIDNPGPRWSGYVFNLKRNPGLAIVTHHEAHRGNFPGTHGRYILKSDVEIISRSDSREQEPA
ncbi:MAG: hypothetical protein ABJA10_00835 [Aestuariivirga sp.]